MAGLFRKYAPIAGMVLLAGCQLALPSGGGPPASGPNPVTGGAIEVTALPDLPGGAAAHPAAIAPAVPVLSPASVATPTPAAAGAAASAAPPAVAPGTDPATAAADAPAAPVAADPVPVARKSEAQLACERGKGTWARAGNGSHACVTRTRDNGKACTRAGQCDSLCLARSGTCAPFKPLFGCNDILDDSGRRMTQCLQ